MTNFEKIKAMSIEEMAKAISQSYSDCSECPILKTCKVGYRHFDDPAPELWGECEMEAINWLESEAEEDD